MRTFVLLLALFVFPVCSYGQSFTVLFGSQHYITDESKNETNPGVIVDHEITKRMRLKYGVYDNSENKTTLFLSAGYEFELGNYVRTYFGATAASGYGTLIRVPTVNTFVFLPVNITEIGPKQYSLTIINIPSVVGFGVTINF